MQLKLILRGKRLGFSLAESRQIIGLYNPATGNREQLELLLSKIAERQAQLRQQMRDIRLMYKELEEAALRCRETLETRDPSGSDQPKTCQADDNQHCQRSYDA